jgi:hypothetical protein
MAPAINFVAGPGFTIQDLAGSGLGFFGAGGFGASVQVGYWQGRTFITNGTGTTQGPEVNNVQYLNSGSGVLGQSGSGIPLLHVPNYQATLNIRGLFDSAVKTQNVQLRIFDRVDPANPPSGVTTAVAEIVHPNPIQGTGGSGSSAWVFPTGNTYLTLTASPGMSGQRPNGANTTDTQHDWYIALSASPNSVGSKTNYGLYVSMEFL